ncbi:MAG: peptidoglycan bridge formation glycyltransferase FemA/FemB family protein [Promethearchaeota archaeon]
MKNIRKRPSDLSQSEIEEIEIFINSNLSTVFHELDFNKIVEKIFNTEFSYNLIYDEKGKIIALCPLHSIKDNLLIRTYSNLSIYEVPYGGWIYNKKEISLLDLLNHIKVAPNESLMYWSIPQITSNDYLEIKNKKEFQTLIIDLSWSLDEIFYKRISKNTRHNINRAPRKGVVIEKLNPNNFIIFITLFNSLKYLVGLKIHPNDYYIKIFEHYYPKKKTCAFASKIGDKYLSGILIIGNKRIMHAWIAGRAENIPKNVYQNELLWWETIKWAKESGAKYYDLCVIEPERLPNIARFKLGFSKEIIPFYTISKRPFGYRLLSRIQKQLKIFF